MKNDVAGGNGIMTADEMYAVYDGVTYALESVMPKTGLAALKKNEHGKTIIFNVPKAEITAAWLIHKIPIYGKLRCDNITLSGSRCFITASVICPKSEEGSRRAAQLKSLGFECFACDEAADTACYIKQTDISDALLEFDESVSDINIMNFI